MFTENLKDLIEKSGVVHKDNSVSYIFTCPRCNKKNKLYIRKHDGRFCCFRCKESSDFYGSAEFALSEILNRNIHEIKDLLYGDVTVSDLTHLNFQLNDYFGEQITQENETVVIPSVCWDWDFYEITHKHSKSGVDYLKSRGIPIDIAQRYGVRYSPTKRSIAFPITSKNRLVGWQTRIIDENRTLIEETGEIVERSKALTTKSLPKEKLLMFNETVNCSDHAVLCEGPIDAIKAHLCGGNVCTMGKIVSVQQMQLLKNAGINKLYIALDPDASLETGNLFKKFNNYFESNDIQFECYDMRAPKPYKDLGQMDFNAVYDLFKSAKKIEPGQLFFYLDS